MVTMEFHHLREIYVLQIHSTVHRNTTAPLIALFAFPHHGSNLAYSPSTTVEWVEKYTCKVETVYSTKLCPKPNYLCSIQAWFGGIGGVHFSDS